MYGPHNEIRSSGRDISCGLQELKIVQSRCETCQKHDMKRFTKRTKEDALHLKITVNFTGI